MNHAQPNPPEPRDPTTGPLKTASTKIESIKAEPLAAPALAGPTTPETHRRESLLNDAGLPQVIAPIPEPIEMPMQMAEMLRKGNLIALRRRRP